MYVVKRKETKARDLSKQKIIYMVSYLGMCILVWSAPTINKENLMHNIEGKRKLKSGVIHGITRKSKT